MHPTPPNNQSSSPVLSPTLFGSAMLMIGVIIGYLIHPVMTGVITPATPTALAARPAPLASEPTIALTPTPDAALATQAAAVMEAVVARTRHFKGSPTAPITLIEFGDYQ